MLSSFVFKQRTGAKYMVNYRSLT